MDVLNWFFIGVLLFSALGSIAGMELSFFFLAILTVLQIKRIFVNGIFKRPIFPILSLFILFAINILFSDLLSGASSAFYRENLLASRFVIDLVVLTAIFSCLGYESLKKAYPWFSIHFLWLSLFGVYQGLTGWVLNDWDWVNELGQGIYRTRGFFSNTMTYSYVFAIWMVLYFSLILGNKPKSKKDLVPILAFFFCGLSLLFTQTRGMWIALACGVLFIVYQSARKYFFRIAVGTGAFFALLLVTVPGMSQRFMSIFDFQNLSNNIRLELWKIHLSLFLEKPVFGQGFQSKELALSNYYKNNESIHSFMGHAHNNLMQIASSMGLLGLSLYVATFLGVFVFMYKSLAWLDASKRKVMVGILAAQVVFHIGGLTECTFLDSEVIFSLVIVVAFGFVLIFESNLKNKENEVLV